MPARSQPCSQTTLAVRSASSGEIRVHYDPRCAEIAGAHFHRHCACGHPLGGALCRNTLAPTSWSAFRATYYSANTVAGASQRHRPRRQDAVGGGRRSTQECQLRSPRRNDSATRTHHIDRRCRPRLDGRGPFTQSRRAYDLWLGGPTSVSSPSVGRIPGSRARNDLPPISRPRRSWDVEIRSEIMRRCPGNSPPSA